MALVIPKADESTNLLKEWINYVEIIKRECQMYLFQETWKKPINSIWIKHKERPTAALDRHFVYWMESSGYKRYQKHINKFIFSFTLYSSTDCWLWIGWYCSLAENHLPRLCLSSSSVRISEFGLGHPSQWHHHFCRFLPGLLWSPLQELLLLDGCKTHNIHKHSIISNNQFLFSPTVFHFGDCFVSDWICLWHSGIHFWGDGFSHIAAGAVERHPITLQHLTRVWRHVHSLGSHPTPGFFQFFPSKN